tara:strand:- start:527 stop:736 length:210 start_codon:yes stop_codon:yes gene_type:complete
MSLAHIHFNKIQSCIETIAKFQNQIDNFIPYANETDEMNERILNVDKSVVKLLKIRLDEIINEAKKELI